MPSLVVVAIPSEDDYVNQISSETVPHCTLLYLGEAQDRPVLQIMQFLEHAVNTLEMGPFMLEVDRRGTLGDAEADVLFFRNNYGLKRLREFRGQLLKDNKIRTAFEESDQFYDSTQEWIPHLTLGYPATPAHEDKRDFPGMRWVDFDRIALWYGDYQGPEFRLQYPDYDLAEVAMSSTAEAGRNFLKHYGVKGMRWGQRKETDTTARVKGSPTGKTKVKTEGGHGQPAHVDAVQAAINKQKLKKSGPAALSNNELRELATRIQLENQVKQLTGARGKKFVTDTLATTGKQQVVRVATAKATQGVDSTVLKRR